MKNIACLFMGFILIASCSLDSDSPSANQSFIEYFNDAVRGVKTGGVRKIVIETPKGNFNVWTKSFGHNIHTRVLLLNGGLLI